MDWISDLEATCSSIGTWDGANYIKGEDCTECVKDLIRLLRRDDENREIRRRLGEIQVVQFDLIPLVKNHADDPELFDLCLRLLVDLTSPELILFREEVPEDKMSMNFFLQLQTHRQKYQRAFVDADLWKVLSSRLGQLLGKEASEREEEEELIVERILILVRNILQVPRDNKSERRTDDDVSNLDQVLWMLHKSGVEDYLLYIASAEKEMQYCLHVLEIISHMFREQDPSQLATANFHRSKDEKSADERALLQVRQRELEMKKMKLSATSGRHSRFGGTFVVQNVKSIDDKRSLICNQPLKNLDFDKAKRPKKVARNKMAPLEEVSKRPSTLAIRLFLKEFCIEFLGGAYNSLMRTIKDRLVRQSAQQNDESYYLWSMRFFMEFNRKYDFQAGLISETMHKSVFHYIGQQIDAYLDHFDSEKRNRRVLLLWSRRIHLGLRAYSELLSTLVVMENSKDPEMKRSAEVLMASIFYEPEYRELCLQLFQKYATDKMTLGFLKDLVETTHVFLKLMEHMAKSNHLTVAKKSKKRKGAGKKKKKDKNGVSASAEVRLRQSGEEMWESVSGKVLSLLQDDDPNLPTNVAPFDATLEIDIEDQKAISLYRIQDCLKKGNAAVALALLRASREVWPEGEVFGASDAEPEDEFITLREIILAEMKKPAGLRETVEMQEASDDVDENKENENTVASDNEEEEDEEEEEEEETVEFVTTEQGFEFRSFILRFAVPSVCCGYVHLFKSYGSNSDFTNHCIVKMFHRIAYDCQMPGLLFQVSLFRVFQKIDYDFKIFPDIKSIREMYVFGKFLLAKFFDACQTNRKIFMELCFWKSNSEALQIVGGYSADKPASKKTFWSEEDEETLSRMFGQMKEMREKDASVDILGALESVFVEKGKTRRQIVKKMKQMGLIDDTKGLMVKGSRKVGNTRRRRRNENGGGGGGDGPQLDDQDDERRIKSKEFVDTTDDSSSSDDDDEAQKKSANTNNVSVSHHMLSRERVETTDNSSDDDDKVGKKDTKKPESQKLNAEKAIKRKSIFDDSDDSSNDEDDTPSANLGNVKDASGAQQDDSENDSNDDAEPDVSRARNGKKNLPRVADDDDSDSAEVERPIEAAADVTAKSGASLSDSSDEETVKRKSKGKRSMAKSLLESDSSGDEEDRQKSPVAKKARQDENESSDEEDVAVVDNRRKIAKKEFLDSDSDDEDT